MGILIGVNVLLLVCLVACLAEISELRRAQKRWKLRYFRAKQTKNITHL